MWEKIIGHKRQTDQLRQALSKGRMPGAYLFVGPAGVGKRLVADTFAAAAFCNGNDGDEFDGCGKCASCHKLASGNHPDFFSAEPEVSERGVVQTIKIGTIRELQSKLQFAPLEAKRKIAVIDGADRLMEAAANSLLKILEEPPDATHFILITPYPHRLLATIRSRSQMIPFGPVPEAPLAREIAIRHSIPETEAIRIARLSGGSLGTAMLLDPEFVDGVMGKFLPLAERASSADIIQTAEEWKGIDLERTPLVFDLLASWYRDLLRLSTGCTEEALIHPEAAERGARTGTSRILRSLASINQARLSAETSANKQLMFEQLLFSLTAS